MKKISIFLVVALLVTSLFAGFVYADSSDSTVRSVSETSFSEYDILKNSIDKSKTQLMSMGMSSDEAQKSIITTEDLRAKIKELKSKSTKELSCEGFTATQIKSLQSISDSSLNSATFSLDVVPMGTFGSVYFSLSYKGLSSSKYSFAYNWYWSGAPLFRNIDGIAFAWDQGFRASSSDVVEKVTYTDGNFSGTKTPSQGVKIVAGAGWSGEFNVLAGPPTQSPAWSSSGYGTFKLTNPNNSKSIQIVWKYGHTTVTVTGLGMDIKGTPGISFGYGVEEMFAGDKIITF